MNVVSKLKENLFTVFIASVYAVMLIIKPAMGLIAVKNSGYYIKEMLLIMPVIFILTALLDTWIPKQTIIKYLGKNAGFKGLLLSFVLGGVSAGPIYAAFPFCVMLRKKGSSIRNIVIILSSWAVIKLPMLLNEVEFLGVKFMAIRWVLTVTSIIIFSWITSLIVKDEDMPDEKSPVQDIKINDGACMGCALCVENYPELFEMRSNKAIIKKNGFAQDSAKLKEAAENCPANAIEYN